MGKTLNKQTFFALVDQTWQQLFDRSLAYAEPQSQEKSCLLECFVEIPIKGEHTFLLVLALPKSLTYFLASLLFQLDQSEISQEDADDSLNEIGNILAGSIQKKISEETTLDLPISLTKDKAMILMKDIQPDWEIYLKDADAYLYAGVFIATSNRTN